MIPDLSEIGTHQVFGNFLVVTLRDFPTELTRARFWPMLFAKAASRIVVQVSVRGLDSRACMALAGYYNALSRRVKGRRVLVLDECETASPRFWSEFLDGLNYRRKLPIIALYRLPADSSEAQAILGEAYHCLDIRPDYTNLITHDLS